jgi:hypothetical protein
MKAELRPAPVTGTPLEPDRARRTVIGLLTVCGFAIPVVAYIWMIHHFSVNTIYADQWSDVNLVSQSYSHKLTWSDLWAQHAEHRMLFPNLIVLGLAYSTNLNTTLETYVAAVMLLAAIALIIWSHQRRSHRAHWWYYVPVAALMLSFAQFQNSLWGFQLAWYLILLMFAITIALLDDRQLSWFVLAIAGLAAIVGSFSSLQGLIIWPVGLWLLFARRGPRAMMLAWVIAAVATTATYLWGFNGRESPMKGGYLSPFEHPVQALKFVVVLLGEVVGQPIDHVGFAGLGSSGAFVVGLAILLAVIVVLVRFGARRDNSTGRPIGMCLVLFGALFCLMITDGRLFEGGAFAGLINADQSRFTTYTLLIPVGIYLVVLDSILEARYSIRPVEARSDADEVPVASSVEHVTARRHKRFPTALAVIGAATLALVALVVVGDINGTQGAGSFRSTMIFNSRVLVNADKYPKSDLGGYLVNYEPRGAIRSLANFARLHHLSVFDTPAAAQYAKQGMPGGCFFCTNSTSAPASP